MISIFWKSHGSRLQVTMWKISCHMGLHQRQCKLPQCDWLHVTWVCIWGNASYLPQCDWFHITESASEAIKITPMWLISCHIVMNQRLCQLPKCDWFHSFILHKLASLNTKLSQRAENYECHQLSKSYIDTTLTSVSLPGAPSSYNLSFHSGNRPFGGAINSCVYDKILMQPFPFEATSIPNKLHQYHAPCGQGNTRSQIIRSHDIDTLRITGHFRQHAFLYYANTYLWFSKRLQYLQNRYTGYTAILCLAQAHDTSIANALELLQSRTRPMIIIYISMG